MNLWLTTYRLPYLACSTVRSTRTTMVFSILFETTTPVRRRRRVVVALVAILFSEGAHLSEHAGDALARLANFADVAHLTDGQFDAELVELGAVFCDHRLELVAALAGKFILLHRAYSRVMILVFTGSLYAARRKASCATSAVTPSISNMTV